MLFITYLLTLISLLTLTTSSPPPTPELSYLYTAYVQCAGNLLESQQNPNPSGIRKTIPIIGGNFTGPRLSGTSLLSLAQYNRNANRQVKSSTSAQTGARQTPEPISSPPTPGTTSGQTTGRTSLCKPQGPSRHPDSCICGLPWRREVRSIIGLIILLVRCPLSLFMD